MEAFVDIFIAVWLLVFALLGVRQRWYRGIHGGWRYGHDPSKIFIYTGWRLQALRILAILIAAVALMDFWHRASGRGALLH